MVLRLLASDPAFERMNELSWMICMAVNPHMVLARDMNMPEVEMKALVNCLLNEAEKWIDQVEFLNFEIAGRHIGEAEKGATTDAWTPS